MKKIYDIPKNWQDFEDLCKEIWQEEWKCREIQAHGRSGQKQYGVDIFGIPNGETNYYGIQCKHRSIGEQLTETEIDQEIENAKGFPVPLKMLYITTTADNDAKLQKHIMEIDIDNRKKGIFGVAIFSWQEICDRLRKHKNVLDWYLTEKFSNRRMELVINGLDVNSEEITLEPKYIKRISKIQYRPPVEISNDHKKSLEPSIKLYENIKQQYKENPIIQFNAISSFRKKLKINKSLIELTIDISNSGDDPIENFYIFIDINDNDYSNGVYFQDNDILVQKDDAERMQQQFRYDGENEIINSGMMKTMKTHINLSKEESKIMLTYDFYSKNYKTNGLITILSKPILEEKIKIKTTNNRDEENITEEIETITEEVEYNTLQDIII